MARNFTKASSQYLATTSTPITAPPWTMVGWFKVTTLTAGNYICAIADSSVTDQRAGMNVAGDKTGDPLAIYHFDGGSSGSTETGNSYSVDVWQHGAAIFASTTSRVVVLNGDWANRGARTEVRNSTGFDRITIGTVGDLTPSDFLDGDLADVAYWNVALTEAEINILAAGFSPRFVRPQNLVFYAPLIRDEDRDIVGGLSLTPVNAPLIAPHPRIIQPSAQILQFPSAAAVPWNQDQYRFGADDGNEASHGWIAAQNTDINQAGSTPAILRIQATTGGDQPTQQMKLQVKKTSDADSFYADVPVA